MIRLFIAPLGTKDQIVGTLEQVRGDAQEMLRFGGQVKREFLDGRAALQDQAYIRALAVDFFVSLLRTVDSWAERTLVEIEGWEDLSPDGKNERGLEIFAGLPAPDPDESSDQNARTAPHSEAAAAILKAQLRVARPDAGILVSRR